jgi:GT2 family glycosyltransferase
MFNIVIPVHDDLRHLRLTLAGFLAQRGPVPPYEIILVDNNSLRESPDAAYVDFVHRLPLLLLRQPMLPHPFALCRARNLGLTLSHYPWIVTLGSDCVPNPDYLANLAASARAAARGMFVGERVFIDASGVAEAAVTGDPAALARAPRIASAANYGKVRDRRFPQLEQLEGSEHPWAFMHGGNIAFPALAARAVGGFDEAYDGEWGYEDIDFAFRAITEGGLEPRYVPGMAVYHVERRDDTVQRRANKIESPNWRRIASRIPGFAEFKARQFASLQIEVRL